MDFLFVCALPSINNWNVETYPTVPGCSLLSNSDGFYVSFFSLDRYQEFDVVSIVIQI